VQHALAGIELLYHCKRLRVDYLDAVIVGQGEINPHLAAIGARHDENRLPLYLDATGLLPGTHIDHQHFVTADRRHESEVAGNRPALEVWHLVNW
jgi:hypothetical protein